MVALQCRIPVQDRCGEIMTENIGKKVAQRKHGFTLIELMVVVVIVGILATVAVASYKRFTQRARVEEAIKYVEPERLSLNPDCGFSPGRASEVPLDEAYLKLKNEAEAARRLRERYG